MWAAIQSHGWMNRKQAKEHTRTHLKQRERQVIPSAFNSRAFQRPRALANSATFRTHAAWENIQL